MTQEDLDAINNLEALKGTFQNYANWAQQGIDVITNGRPSDRAIIADLAAQNAALLIQVPAKDAVAADTLTP